MDTGKHLVLFFDGSCEPVNPNGTMGMGVVAYETTNFKTYFFGMDSRTSYDSCKIIEKVSCKIKLGDNGYKTTTNNIAEYIAFFFALQIIDENDIKDATIFGDSQMVVRQMNGEWKIKNGAYTSEANKCQVLLGDLRRRKNIRIEWIPRELNTVVDVLSK